MAKFSISAKRALMAAGVVMTICAFVGTRATADPVSSAHAAAAVPHEVAIDNFSFGPGILTVASGTQVVWTNRDDDPHTVTSAAGPKLLHSPPLDTGESFAFTFDKPGTYRYFCSIHPQMQGVIVVR